MNYIILDLEWNHPEDGRFLLTEPFSFDSEIIEIGAVKLNDEFEPVDEYKSYVRPVFYPFLNSAVAELTKIRPQLLAGARTLPEVCGEFFAWCGDACCLCSWGPTDLPVLYDNMLMHGMSLPESPLICDLQRVFGREIMRDERQCSLENALALLGLERDRSHDALNDARNTVRVCERMDLAGCVDEYWTRAVGYGPDRLAGLAGGRQFPGLEEALGDESLKSVECPYCGADAAVGDWVRSSPNTLLGCAVCPEGDEYLLRLKHRRFPGGTTVSRLVFEMSDDWWEIYQTALERQREK